MATYKGKYTQQQNSRYRVELFEDHILKKTLENVFDEADAKAEIIVWHAQKGYTDLSVTSDNFTPDMENFDSLYCL
mgnify:CR=1 FL=1|tara:strand:+ start:2393 stop:2620 length:228 start_codon:yes stop_codon:yes gene_type:complete